MNKLGHTFSHVRQDCARRGPRLLLALLLVPGLLGFSACQATRNLPDYQPSAEAQDNPRRRPARPTTVGTVAMVNREDKFVLIEMQSNRTLPPGSTLQAFSGQMKSATLKVSKEKRPPFLIADIMDGSPARSDLVLLEGRGTPEPATTTKRRGGGGSSGPGYDPNAYAGPAPELELLPADDDDGPDQSGFLAPPEDDMDLPDGPAPMLDPLPPLETSP